MRYRITASDGKKAQTHFGIGDPGKAADAFYDAGFTRVTVMVIA